MTQVTHPSSSPSLTRGVLQRGGQVFGALLLYALLLFLSAGRLDWPAAWYYLAVNLIVIVVNSTVLLIRDPAFIAARGQPRQDTKTWDKWISALAGVFMVVNLIVPGLDLRFGWSTAFPLLLQIIGFVVLIAGYALFSWAMLSNEFFETSVRIQSDRGQTVATTGPYRFVRHPGYVGMILQLLSTPPCLASWWGLIPALLASATFIVRTAFEDRTLHDELGGYKEFAQRVRYRLVPGLW